LSRRVGGIYSAAMGRLGAVVAGLVLVCACKQTPASAPPGEPAGGASGPGAAPAPAPTTAHEREPTPAELVRTGPIALELPPEATSDMPDAVILRQASERRAAGDLKGTRDALVPMVLNHPNSPLLPYGYILLGELDAEAGRHEEAMAQFGKAPIYKTSPAATAYARYRIGWCLLAKGDHARALEAFEAAKEAAKRAGDVAVARASVLDSAAAYARVGELAKAAEFYGRMANGVTIEVEVVLSRVAEIAIDSGRRDELAQACAAAGSPGWCARPLARA
jgi:tetratricopeptide (TPR) repeat protein